MKYFDEMPINTVIERAKSGNRSAYHYIIRRYMRIIHGRIKKKSYFLQGGDYDDLFQEGMFGLYKAIQDFKPENGEFDVFSKICIDRQLISAIKTSTRKKHSPLNEMISLDRTLPENDNLNMMDLLGARDDVQYKIDFDSLSPDNQMVLRETSDIQRKMLEESLSSKEKAVFELYLENKTYKEIMDDLGVENPKMIDNAIQRVKRKIERVTEVLKNNNRISND